MVYQKLADLKALPPNKLAVCLLYFISNINLLHHEESIIVMYYKVILVSILVVVVGGGVSTVLHCDSSSFNFSKKILWIYLDIKALTSYCKHDLDLNIKLHKLSVLTEECLSGC